MSGKESKTIQYQDDEEEFDDWDKRIFSTGCRGWSRGQLLAFAETGLDEQLKMNDCYYDHKDWRICKKEMEAFRECWKRHGNERRTESKNA